MRIKELLIEDIERLVDQKIYMEGQCAVLAIAIHEQDPNRYQLGFVQEYTHPGTGDVYLDPDDWQELDSEEQKEVELNNLSIVHAYVYDTATKEYIDASGRHKQIPSLGYPFNATRKNVFPAEPEQLIRAFVDMEWDQQKDDWQVIRGEAAFRKYASPDARIKAINYATKYLDVDKPEASPALLAAIHEYWNQRYADKYRPFPEQTYIAQLGEYPELTLTRLRNFLNKNRHSDGLRNYLKSKFGSSVSGISL